MEDMGFSDHLTASAAGSADRLVVGCQRRLNGRLDGPHTEAAFAAHHATGAKTRDATASAACDHQLAPDGVAAVCDGIDGRREGVRSWGA